MKVIVAGSRTLCETEPFFARELEDLIDRFEKDYGKITMIVSGMARGPDKLGVNFAVENGLHLAKFPAQWDLHGKAAGPIRNAEMGDFADGAIIMWDGESKGAKHMADYMRKLGKPFIIDIFKPMIYKVKHLPTGILKRVYHSGDERD